MTYFCDIRQNSFNNVMEFNSRLFVEGQEYTPINFAPIALSYAPTNYQVGTVAGPAIGQLALGRTYVRGGMGIWPQNGAAGQFDSTRIACGQDVHVGAVWSATQGRLYAAAGTNGLGLSTFDPNLRMLAQGTIAVSNSSTFNNCYPVHLFCPLSNGRWIVFTCISGSGVMNYTTSWSSAASLTETGTAGSVTTISWRIPCIPLIGDNQVIVLGVPWSNPANPVDVSIYAVNRVTGAFSTVSGSWIPWNAFSGAGSFSWIGNGVWPSNAVLESPTQCYFYYPLLSSSALTIYIGTVSGLGSGGTPAINAYNAAGATLTAVGGGPLDTSALTNIPSTASTLRQVRAFVTTVSGVRHLHVYVFEPGSGATINPGSCQLYVWRLDSKTTATFVQRVDLGTGRLRALMPTDSSQTRVVAVYDDRLVFYSWAAVSESWILQSTQPLQTGDVGIDTTGRVWATTSYGTYRSAGTLAQELHIFENVGPAATISAQFDDDAYTFTGTTLSANIIVNAYDTAGNRVALGVRLDRISTNFEFAGGATTIVTTSTSADTLVPISIFSTGQLSCRAAPSS